jgi:hypothetical protein
MDDLQCRHRDVNPDARERNEMAEADNAPIKEAPEGENADASEAPKPDALKPEASEPEERLAAASVFVTDPEGLPESMDSPFWEALPKWDDFRALEGSAPVGVATEIRLAHDARTLAVYVRCEEPDMDATWSRRVGGKGHLDLDDSVEILLDPYGHGFSWGFRVTPHGEWETVLPVGAVAGPECAVEVRAAESGWRALLLIPIADVGLEGDLRSTPLDGQSWGFAVVRRRREAVKGEFAGAREVAAFAAGHPAEMSADAFARLAFQGGRTKAPFEFMRYNAGGFGVNEICVTFGKTKIPPGVETGLKPAPAAKLRSKDISRYKFRVARPGLYRYFFRLPYQPPPEPTEEEIAEWERELGQELSEEELTDKLAERTGDPEYVAGLAFLLKDVWTEVEEMEDAGDVMRRSLSQAGIALTPKMTALFGELEEALEEVDRFRAPHAKGRLGPEQTEKLQAAFDDVRAAVRGALLRHGKLSIASPYLASGKWALGTLRARTDHSEGTESAETTAAKLAGAGLDFCAFADRPEGGDQDGDGAHDWNGDGTVAPAARPIPGTRRSVREDRGREAYVRDYSRSAAEQGKPWVGENWNLSTPDKFVVLRAVEVGPHRPVLCLGVPAGGLPEGAGDGYDAIGLALSAGGLAVMCEAPGDLREIPSDLSSVLGIDAPEDAWERLLKPGRRIALFPGTKLDGADIVDGKLPERTVIAGVLAEAHTEDAILSALRRGSLYVTTATGPRITGVEVRGGTLKVSTDRDCQFLFRDETGAILGGGFGGEAEYRFTGRERCVRAVALSDVLEDGFRLAAATQPFYLSDDLPSSPEGVADPGWTIAELVDRSDEPEEPEEDELDEELEEEAEEEASEEAGEAEQATEAEAPEEAAPEDE